MELRDYVTDEVLKGKLGHIKVVYARPLSIIVQRVQTLNLLPCSEEVKGGSQSTSETVPDIIMESTPEDLIEYLIYLWVGQKLVEVFGLSRLAEVAARFMHAEDSSQKIKEMNNQLRIEFVRARHEIVDQQMRELFAARIV
jgi:F0F1-type ATP synthase gamma subunit